MPRACLKTFGSISISVQIENFLSNQRQYIRRDSQRMVVFSNPAAIFVFLDYRLMFQAFIRCYWGKQIA
jgi:hypothetical protein